MSSRLCPFCMRMTEGDTCPHCGKNVNYTSASSHLPAGYVVSGKHPYVMGAVLGQGGFGITYIALDMVSNERVAIKEYFPTFCAGRTDGTVSAYPNQEEIYLKGKDRFLDEARTLKSLSDLPNIVNVLDFFEGNNTAYLVMEFLDGSSLKEHAAKHGKFPAQKFLQQIKPLMEDIHRMHERGVIHRDIAPDNIILLPDGQMKLIDFGAARSFVGDRSMTVVVKKGFAPVEQYMSKGSSSATDVYALAATIYYCITGVVPADSAERQYDNTALELPSNLGADMTSIQENALIKAMEIQQKSRTQSVQEFLDAFQARKATLSKEPPALQSLVKENSAKKSTNSKSRRKVPALFLVVAAVLLLCAGSLLFSKKNTEPPVSAAHISHPTIDSKTVPPETREKTIPVPAYLPAENPTYSEDAWAENLLHKDFSSFDEKSHSPRVYGSNIPRRNILSVTFLDTLKNAPDTCWDVSNAHDGSVLAWTVKNGTDYDLYLAGEGGINAGTSTYGLFSNFEKVNVINNFQFFHMENVSDARNMFWKCVNLTAFDFSQNNLSSIEDMSCMFSDCSNLMTVSLSNLDLSNVDNMSGMFSGCSNLSTCDFSKTKIADVTHADDVFFDCPSLITVKFGVSEHYHPKDFIRMLKDSTFFADDIPESAVPVSIVYSGSDMAVIAEDLEIRITNERDVSVTISNLQLEEFYITDFNDKENYYYYSWVFDMCGSDSYRVSTNTSMNSSYKDGRATLDEMEHRLSFKKDRAKSVLSRIGDAKMTHTQKSITWTFRIPAEYPFDFSEMTSFQAGISTESHTMRMRPYVVVSKKSSAAVR